MPQILSGAGVTSPTQLAAFPLPSKLFSTQPQDWMFAVATGGIVNNTAVQIAAAVTNMRNYLTALQIATGTLTAATELVILDAAAIIWRVNLGTAALPLMAIEFPTPLFTSTGNAMSVQILTTATGGVWVGAQGFVGV